MFFLLGLGTDEKAIIQILGHRNSNQIKLIKQAYQELYQEDLIHQLKSELCGDLLVCALFNLHNIFSYSFISTKIIKLQSESNMSMGHGSY